MDTSILSGTKKPIKSSKTARVRIHNLKQQSAWDRAKKTGRKTNHNQIDGRRWKHDHPAHPYEHDIPNPTGKR